MSRRRFLAVVAAGAGAVAVGTLEPTAEARAATTGGSWSGRESANGWPVLARADRHPIEGSGEQVALAGGAAAVILTYVARRFHYEIDQLRPGDVQGHRAGAPVTQVYESNYLSGSALAIRPQAYPLGVRGGLYPGELVVVQDILAEFDGVVAWGGDFPVPKESHFEIAYGPRDPRVSAAAHRVTGWTEGPGGQGAGAIDAFAPVRRTRALAFARGTR